MARHHQQARRRSGRCARRCINRGIHRGTSRSQRRGKRRGKRRSNSWCASQSSQGLHQHRLLAFAGAGEHEHRPRSAPGLTARKQVGIGRGVELEVAKHPVHHRPRLTQPARVVLGLGPHRRQAAVGGPRQRRQALRAAQGLFGQTRIGQGQWDPAAGAGVHQVGPDLGFHQYPGAGLEMGEKGLDRPRRVPGQPGLGVTRPQQALALGAPGGGAMRQQHPKAGLQSAQRLQQGGGGTGLAERDRMDPEGAGTSGRQGLLIAAKALAHRRQVTGLSLATAAHLARQQGLGAAHGQGVQRTREVHAADTSSQAASTASRPGWGWANTLRWRALPTGPVRQAVSWL